MAGTHRYLWLTGATRGLGLALAERAAAAGWQVQASGRGDCPSALQGWQAQGRLHWSRLDLSQVEAARTWLQACQAQTRPMAGDVCALVLNAGVIAPIAALDALPLAALENALRVNLLAPMWMAGAFAELSAQCGCEARLLAISSGAARRPSAHWGAYCVGKAGLDMLVRVANAEARAGASADRFKAVALAPGVIDTEMQATIRQQVFPDLERYRQLHQQHRLQAPMETADAVLAYLQRPDFGSKEIDDIRDYF